MKQKHIITKIHLIISVLIVIPAAFIYGFQPQLFLDISYKTIDERNFSKAIMGIYLAFSILWILGIFKRKFLSFALLSNVLFMIGLGLGRIISLILDGIPSIVYVIGIFGELLLGFYGLWVLNSKYYKKM
ncbi:hypothetical protein BWZ20_08965 [Winogradskyella sp. J14-2]|uniref:DUF4345 domain-containing protein n=1 Tax=Winogradskyella sp. J14-2 TaxID=1936080 RepID=UPI00097268FE|nr:DUF4345 domain-containing protein [Winogradskyella sp. J14-2]APY08418.1 hypothetical protein BWZ20_08965 [Winogradskyella sp. J14-2]